MRSIAILLFSAAAWAGLFCAAASAAPGDLPKLPPELDRIVQLANSSPPEFAADALLRVAAVSKLDKRNRADLIDRAFHLATGAQFHVPVNIVAQVPDTSAGMVAAAQRLKLDTLSLQTRAVSEMIDVDKKAARQLFLEIDQPVLEALKCDQPTVPDLSALYEVLAPVANQTFTEQERKKEENINLVMGVMSRATSPVQLAPMEQMIGALAITPEQRDILRTRVNAMRQSLGGTPCKDTQTASASSRPDAFWKSDQAKHLFDEGIHLRMKDNGTPYSDAERNTTEWFERLTDYLKDVGNWSASDEKDEATYYHEKAIIYEMLVELTPAGSEREKALEAYVEFVANSGLQREKPVEWYFHAQSLLNRVRNNNVSDAAGIFAAFENSGNPVLMLYTALDRTLGETGPGRS